MKKIFILFLVAVALRGFSQTPLNGQFYDFLGESKPGTFPFFKDLDNQELPQYANFYPSLLKQYGDEHFGIRYGIDLGIEVTRPEAKLEINANHVSIPALKVYGGTTGLVASGENEGINTQGAIGLIAVGSNYGIFQTGGISCRNYFQSKTGINNGTPTAMLDIIGDMKCTGPVFIGNRLDIYNADSANPFIIRTGNTSLHFNFVDLGNNNGGGGGLNGMEPPNGWLTLMSLTSDENGNQVDVTGAMNISGAASAFLLNVSTSTKTNTFRMTHNPGNNNVMVGDSAGNGKWTDVTPWIDKYWKYTLNNNMYSQGSSVGIGTGDSASMLYGSNKLSVVSSSLPVGLFVQNKNNGTTRHGIVSYVSDNPENEFGGGVGMDGPSGPGNNSTYSDGFYAAVYSGANGASFSGSLAGINSEVNDNGACSGGVYGLKSIIKGSYSQNNKYGIYSEIQGGQSTNRWAGYFKGGNVELVNSNFIIGSNSSAPGKRFKFQSVGGFGVNVLYIIPSLNDSNGTWNASKEIAFRDNGDLYINGKIYAREIEINLDNYQLPDYVFSQDYNLMPIQDLEKFINVNKHLPDIPSASEIKANGANLGDLYVSLLKKVEELTLHIIELKNEIEELKKVGH
jgi:hypothetical protein